MQQKIDSDKVVQNLMASWQASGLKQKLIFTFAIIALFRFGAQLPIYGINNEVFQALASGNNLIGFLDMFSGGALGKVSIFALGIGQILKLNGQFAVGLSADHALLIGATHEYALDKSLTAYACFEKRFFFCHVYFLVSKYIL